MNGKLLNLSWIIFLTACIPTPPAVSTIVPLAPLAVEQEASGSQMCGWVTVNETKVVPLQGVTPRPYDKQLYYCCPGSKKSPSPTCYQAKWVHQK